ncbi:MAG: hypothetical protein WKG01_27420 [Kofleriaceae bacterium]
MSSTVFMDLRVRAIVVYRVTTQASVYVVGFHDQRGRRYVIARGAPGTDREAVVVRDSDPRVGEHSLFELPPEAWIGLSLEIATMTSSPIVAVIEEHDPALISAVGVDGSVQHNPWARPEPAPVDPPGFAAPRPPYFPQQPRIVETPARGTQPVAIAPNPAAIARALVVGAAAPASPAEPETPYPIRQVRYAENAVALLRSLARRERLYEDLAADVPERDRLRAALDELAQLLEVVRRRDRP